MAFLFNTEQAQNKKLYRPIISKFGIIPKPNWHRFAFSLTIIARDPKFSKTSYNYKIITTDKLYL